MLPTLTARLTFTLGAGPVGIALAVLVVVGLSLYTVRVVSQSARVVGRGRALLLGLLRATSFALVAFLLLGPILATSRAVGGRTRLAVIADRSRSMLLPAGEGRTRAVEAAAAWTVVTRAAGVPVRTYAVGRGVSAWPGSGPPGADSSAESQATALGEALASMQPTVDRDGLVGVVLVSDGVSTRGRDPVTAARELGVPVLAVSVGAAARGVDVSVSAFNAPEVVFAGESTNVAVVLRARGAAGAVVPVTVREGPRILARAMARLGGDGDLAVPLVIPPLPPGRHFLSAQAARQSGEVTAENNLWDAALDVRETRQKVLLVSGTTGFDTAFLARTLSADPSLAVSELVATPSGWRAIGESAAHGLPSAAAQWSAFRAVILVNIGLTDLPNAAQGALAAAVENGTGLWWLAGAGGGNGTLSGALSGPAARILPVERRARAGEGGGSVVPALTTVGGGDALSSIAGDASASAAVWDQLPPVIAGDVPLQPRAAARVLVSGRPSGARRDGGDVPLVIVREGDGGRVIVWNGSGFWRWKLAASSDDKLSTAYGTLVQSAMTWLLEEEAGKPLLVRPSASVVRSGEELSFAASLRVRPAAAAGPPRLTLALAPAAASAGAPGIERVFSPDADGDGFSVRVPDLAQGTYTYRVRAVQGSRLLGEATGSVRVSSRSVEFDDVGVDEDALGAVARESGGRFLRSTDPGLEAAVRELAHTRREVPGARLEMWSHPVTLILLLLLLGVEWLLRKRWGLA